MSKQNENPPIIGTDYSRGPDETMVSLHMPLEAAESFSLALSDVLCWCAGFEAALTDLDSRTGPMGTERLRDLNIDLKNAMSRAEGE